MPYIVTIKPPDNLVRMTNPPRQIPVSRRAVATLDEARACIRDHVVGAGVKHGTTADPITPSGGTIGPLPDGTVIEVERVCWNWVIGCAEDLGIDVDAIYEDGGDLAIIAAYNAAQEGDGT